MNGQNNSGLVVLGFKIGETVPCRGVRHHVSIFDLGNGLTANPDDFRQMRLLHDGLPTKRPKSLGSFGFFPWPGVHFLLLCLPIVLHKGEKRNSAAQVPQFSTQSDFLENIRNGHFKGGRQFFKHPESGFPLPIFQFRYVNPSNSRHIGKLLLRPALLLP